MHAKYCDTFVCRIREFVFYQFTNTSAVDGDGWQFLQVCCKGREIFKPTDVLSGDVKAI